MATMEDLERRVAALESAPTTNAQTMKWMAGTLGQIQAAADDHTTRLDQLQSTVDQHTERLERLETELGHVQADVREVKADVRGLKTEVRTLRDDLHGIVTSAVREGLTKKS